MKLLLFDRVPQEHGVDVAAMEPLGLTWHDPNKGGDPDLQGFDAVAVHVTDDPENVVTQRAIAANKPLALYSGDYSIATDRAQTLSQAHPTACLCAVHPNDLPESLRAALKEKDPERLIWDKLSDALEFLESLWAFGLTWEMDGLANDQRNPYDGTLNLPTLAQQPTADGRTIGELSGRIYGRPNYPTRHFQELAVSELDDYYCALANLRDSLLAWAYGER